MSSTQSHPIPKLLHTQEFSSTAFFSSYSPLNSTTAKGLEVCDSYKNLFLVSNVLLHLLTPLTPIAQLM